MSLTCFPQRTTPTGFAIVALLCCQFVLGTVIPLQIHPVQSFSATEESPSDTSAPREERDSKEESSESGTVAAQRRSIRARSITSLSVFPVVSIRYRNFPNGIISSELSRLVARGYRISRLC
jgi:hypothetical protein